MPGQRGEVAWGAAISRAARHSGIAEGVMHKTRLQHSTVVLLSADLRFARTTSWLQNSPSNYLLASCKYIHLQLTHAGLAAMVARTRTPLPFAGPSGTG